MPIDMNVKSDFSKAITIKSVEVMTDGIIRISLADGILMSFAGGPDLIRARDSNEVDASLRVCLQDILAKYPKLADIPTPIHDDKSEVSIDKALESDLAMIADWSYKA